MPLSTTPGVMTEETCNQDIMKPVEDILQLHNLLVEVEILAEWMAESSQDTNAVKLPMSSTGHRYRHTMISSKEEHKLSK